MTRSRGDGRRGKGERIVSPRPSPLSPRLILGITGGIASGKTTVMRMLARRGIPTISADDLAHSCIRRGTGAYRRIVRHFGDDILRFDGQIDRQKLGQIVFDTDKERRWLEGVVHPCVAAGLARFIRTHRGVIALDIPLLFEAHYESWVDRIIVVSCSRAQQLKRLMSRAGHSRAEALRRIAAQMPLAAKRRRADVVLQNTGSAAELAGQIHKKLLTGGGFRV